MLPRRKYLPNTFQKLSKTNGLIVLEYVLLIIYDYLLDIIYLDWRVPPNHCGYSLKGLR